MNFWNFFKGGEEKVKIKDLNLTYYEVSQILNKVDREYDDLLHSDSAHRKEVGTYGKFVIAKIKKKFKSFLEKKYKYIEGEKE